MKSDKQKEDTITMAIELTKTEAVLLRNACFNAFTSYSRDPLNAVIGKMLDELRKTL